MVNSRAIKKTYQAWRKILVLRGKLFETKDPTLNSIRMCNLGYIVGRTSLLGKSRVFGKTEAQIRSFFAS